MERLKQLKGNGEYGKGSGSTFALWWRNEDFISLGDFPESIPRSQFTSECLSVESLLPIVSINEGGYL